jgi:hypothetical protein
LNKTSRRHIQIILACLAIVVLIAGLSACKSKGTQTTPTTKAVASPGPAVSTTPTKKAAASVAQTNGASPVSAKAATPSAVPKLNDISFVLLLEPKQDYTESTTPIFLRANQVLHINWLVVKGGNHFHLTFSLPNGDSIAVRTDGSLAAYSATGNPPEELTKNGSLVFRPSDNDWDDGYYIFHSQIMSGDASVTVKLLYWIEG